MAIGSSVPPRAYTREILTTAFNWLQTQPDSVRSKASTPDVLVGLYMQAQRGGAFSAGVTAFDSEAPVSSQVFMSDLKNLAEGLKEFDDSKQPRAVAPPASQRAQMSPPPTYPQNSVASTPQNTVAPASQNPAAPAPPKFETPIAPIDSPTTAPGLNARSVEMLHEVQMALNLSSEIEVMNLMIAVAHKNLKGLL